MDKIHQHISLQLSVFLTFISLLAPEAMAQVKSDGTTNTLVNANGNNFTILNGIGKGNNLFHSFSNFSIPTGGSASFDLSNTPNITTIFSRVTGGSISNIDGLIQTLNGKSPVSLYLMNPAGIIFGKNASFNIGGSFVGTTANSIKFKDGVEFNATASTPPLLTMSVPIGLQMGQNVALIQVQGNLSAGQDLTLQAGNLNLQGQLVAGRDLTLNAQDTVQIRNTTGPFLAQAGRNLTIQGNENIDILALNQANPALQSGGNLSLISDGNISGDAHFLSGGNVSFETLSGTPGNFISKYDPVIYANGNVSFGDYTGVALKVETTGSIQGGNISITGPDNTVSRNDPDYTTLSTQSALILAAGVTSVPTPNLTQQGVVYGNTNFTTVPVAGLPAGGITLAYAKTSGGPITLTAQGGDIVLLSNDKLDSSSPNNGGTGGAINVSVTNGNISLMNNNSFYSAGTDGGNSGNVTVSATNGNIYFANSSRVNTSVNGGNGGNGGDITISATNGNISFTNGSHLNSPGGNGGNAGAITLSATNGNISLSGNINFNSATDLNDSNPMNVRTGNGGAITLSTTNGNITLSGNSLSSYVLLDSDGGNGGSGQPLENGGAITLSATHGNISLTDSELHSAGGLDPNYANDNGLNRVSLGNGGAIKVSATNGNISFIDDPDFPTSKMALLYSAASGGNGGVITVSTTNGNINSLNSSIESYATAPSGISSGNGGAVTFSATNGSIISTNGYLNSSSKATGGGNSGQGGAITFSATNGISSQGDLYSYSQATGGGNSGQGGAITFSSQNGSISNQGDLLSISLAQNGINSGNSGQGGDISLLAQNGDIVGNSSNLYTFSIAPYGIASNGGAVTLNAQNQISGLTVLTTSSSAQAGAVSIIGQGNLAIADTVIQTSKQVSVYDHFIGGFTVAVDGTGRSGNINISSAGDITLTNTNIQSDAKGIDSAGNINITSPGLVTLNQSQIISGTSNAGNAGNISIDADGLTLLNGTSINSSTNASGNAGEININVAKTSSLDNSTLSTGTSGSGNGGIISLTTADLQLNNNALLSTAASQSGKAGNLTINASGLVDLQNGSQINSSSTGNGDGGTVEITAGSLKLNQHAQINASTTSSAGGNLVLDISQLLQISDRSILNAEAGGKGDGGNITLSTPFLLGSGNSDIIATAVLGHGGNINITTDGIYGLAFRNQLTPDNDITASSQFGVNGTVEITTPGVDPNSALVKLPENVADHSQQITTGCANQSSSSFVASGRGGVPQNPTKELIHERTWSDVRDISAYLKPSNTTHIIAASPESLVQATGWYRNAEGEVELIAAKPSVQVRDHLTCAAVPKN